VAPPEPDGDATALGLALGAAEAFGLATALAAGLPDGVTEAAGAPANSPPLPSTSAFNRISVKAPMATRTKIFDGRSSM
jgi:hypothetical protein